MVSDKQLSRRLTITGFLQRKPIILQVLRFAAIGVINTALDFLILNVISKTFGVSSGLKLGEVNIVGFSAAMVQSYFWNRYWAFSRDHEVDLKNYIVRPVLVGGLGALAVAAVLFGSSAGASAGWFMFMLAIFILLEFGLWSLFGLGKLVMPRQPVEEFMAFLIVSLIGLAVNSFFLGLISAHAQLVANSDLNKNLAKIIATFVSLVWNFIGYKIFVFKK